MAVSPRTRKAAAMVLVPGTDRRCTPAAARWWEKAGPDAPLMSVRSRSKMAADWPIASHHRQRDLDVAPSGVGVRADLVGLLDERHGRIVIEGGDAHVELDLEAEAAAGDRADADRRRDLATRSRRPSPDRRPPSARSGSTPRSRRRRAARGSSPRPIRPSPWGSADRGRGCRRRWWRGRCGRLRWRGRLPCRGRPWPQPSAESGDVCSGRECSAWSTSWTSQR